jgi:hypothetical protein
MTTVAECKDATKGDEWLGRKQYVLSGCRARGYDRFADTVSQC